MKTLETSLLEHLSEFLAFARKRLSSPELAADAVQESLLKALRSSGELRDDESAKAWFYRILRRTIIDLYRRDDVHARAVEKLKVELDRQAAPNLDEERVTCQCMKALLPTMKPEYAELIERLDLGGESTEEASARLGISRNNLVVRHHRARQQLRERLELSCQSCATHGCLDCTCDAPAQNQDNRNLNGRN
ncbi:RNA polymerase sigma factor [Verrucomicrobium spinosum]|uniref:RNA polymerase sigma factor n=1 Tax=Verrucomicrobium spinosum TaxID=2736 RepID=UPI000174438E|nr:RNA polymerase sigma factor [Verrucomicrobium spinosum]